MARLTKFFTYTEELEAMSYSKLKELANRELLEPGDVLNKEFFEITEYNNRIFAAAEIYFDKRYHREKLWLTGIVTSIAMTFVIVSCL